MKRFIRSLFSFAAFCAAFYLVSIGLYGRFGSRQLKANFFFGKNWGGHTFTRLKEAGQRRDVDVLILGSSHAYRSFDTRKFSAMGISSFNMGSSSQTPVQTKMLLERYLDRLNPKTVIYEVYPDIFCEDGVEASLDIIANDNNDCASIRMAIQLRHAAVYNTLVYGFIDQALGLSKGYKEPVVTFGDTYMPGGFDERMMQYFRYVSYPPKAWKFRDDQLKAFRQIMQMLNARRTEIILVYAPVTRSWYEAHTNNSAIDTMLQGYQYYNFNELIQLDDSLHFYDAHHMNQAGVDLFDRQLFEVLKQRRNSRLGILLNR